MKVLGAEFRNWFDNHWPGDDWYMEEPYDVQDEDGKWIWPDDKVLDTDNLGWLRWQGRGNAPRKDWSVTEAFEEWKNGDGAATATVAVTIPKELVDELVAWANARFGKVTQ
jgi:hypothetical protein